MYMPSCGWTSLILLLDELGIEEATWSMASSAMSARIVDAETTMTPRRAQPLVVHFFLLSTFFASHMYLDRRRVMALLL